MLVYVHLRGTVLTRNGTQRYKINKNKIYVCPLKSMYCTCKTIPLKPEKTTNKRCKIILTKFKIFQLIKN